MWTAKITSIAKNKGLLVVLVDFNNGSEIITEEFRGSFKGISLDWLRTQIKQKIDNWDATYAFADTLAINDIIAPADNPPVPTQDDLDRQLFIKDYNRWLQIKKAIDVGILTGNEAQVVAFLNKVKGEFKPAYLDII